MTIVIGMKKRVSKSAFKARALEFCREVESSGDSLILTDHGRPVLEVRPYEEKDSDPLATLRRSVVRYERPTDPVADDEWESGR
jgi:antitoxin (DNA-binding transcriptional repressor) of toxin-antitoxin stability system